MYARFKTVIVFLFALTLAACGGSSSSTTSTNSEGSSNATSFETATYRVEYEQVSTPMEGKSTFTIRVYNKASGATVPGLTLTINPLMTMATAEEHSSPIGPVTDNGDGSYTCTVYYLMASTMNGVSMGTWELNVTINGETATFSPNVMMAMGDTAKATLKNQNDKIAGMTGDAETRTYYLFKESLMGSTGNHMFKLFVATRESMMSHPAVYTGQSLNDENGAAWTVNSITIQVSTDGTTWTDMMESGSGYFMVSGLTGLTDGTEGVIYVKMTINGVQYTTDGAAVSGANGYQAFTVTPGASMSM